MLQYSARSAICMNLSTSKISSGMFFALAGSYSAGSSILSFVVFIMLFLVFGVCFYMKS
jgi:hypothetical protein